MDRFFYALAIGAIIIGIAFPSLRPERLSNIPVSKMNVAHCIELHNEIVRLGWIGMGRPLQDFHPPTWFDYHGQAAQAARRKLSADLVAFLQGAYEIPDAYTDRQYFHYFATALMTPGDDMFGFIDGGCSPAWVNQYEAYHGDLTQPGTLGRYVRLYYANSLVSHPEGLIFDQHTNKAIMCMSIHDSNGLCEPSRIKWHPLEDVLAAWLDMLRTGKVKAVGSDTEYAPWYLMPYTDYQVIEAVGAFNKLVEAVEERMPGRPSSLRNQSNVLLDRKTLEAAQIPSGFAYDFLTSARRPNFRFIAPGLTLPTPSLIPDQPFFGVLDTIPAQHREWFRSPPVLLFRSTLMYERPSSHPYNEHTRINDVFGYPFNLSKFPAGLYFNPYSEGQLEHDDSTTVILPFSIGSNGWARKSDGTLFGENVMEESPKPKASFSEIYQAGHNPFIARHPVRLVHVLKSWAAMVERGDWKVGAEGVANGINEWKNADTRGGWEKYTIPPEW